MTQARPAATLGAMERVLPCDIAIAGGGLAGSLAAYALALARPDLHVLLVEQGETLGGNHVWSFFDSDVGDRDRALLAPLVVHHWDGHHVLFPKVRRRLGTGYNSITSERLDAVVRGAVPAERILCGRRLLGVGPTAMVLADGTRIQARAVIDARGAGPLATLDVRWQKFLGQELRLEAPHGLERPVIMDATVEQIDGFRFVYLLPTGPDRLFVEDTYYSDTPEVDRPALAERIAAYAALRGWRIAAVGREEQGALPVVLGGDFEAYWRAGGAAVPKLGVRAGLFHPTTGYSLPDAVATARLIASQADLSAEALCTLLHDRAAARWRAGGFYRLLDRMLFEAADPPERYRVLQHFYRLDEPLIRHFYAGATTAMEKLRILSGRPPVPVGRALRAIGRSAASGK